MPERQYRTLTKRIVDCLAVNGKDGVFWDSEIPGFGIRVYPTRRKDAAKIIGRLKAGLPPLEQEPEPTSPSATSASTSRCTASPTP